MMKIAQKCTHTPKFVNLSDFSHALTRLILVSIFVLLITSLTFSPYMATLQHVAVVHLFLSYLQSNQQPGQQSLSLFEEASHTFTPPHSCGFCCRRRMYFYFTHSGFSPCPPKP